MVHDAARDSGERGRPPSGGPAKPSLAGTVEAVLRLQRTAGNRATMRFLQRNGNKNRRAREAEERRRQTYTMPTERGGSSKKGQRQKHQEEYEEAMRRFARTILIDSEGSVFVGGHAKTRHGGASDEYLMGRGIPVASAFDTPADQERGVAALLVEMRIPIEDWRDHGKKDRLVLAIDRPDDVHVRAYQRLPGVGPGFNKLDEDDFPYIKGVFQKDDVSMENPWGLVTCFPSQQD